jgi:predicted signal transduction protein with EAL and GGDEF domain
LLNFPTLLRSGNVDQYEHSGSAISSGSEATQMAERMAELLRAPIGVGDREVVVTASVGIALSTSQHDRTESILRNADLALYRAKAAGKARWALFEARIERDALEGLELEANLRQALMTSEQATRH